MNCTARKKPIFSLSWASTCDAREGAQRLPVPFLAVLASATPHDNAQAAAWPLLAQRAPPCLLRAGCWFSKVPAFAFWKTVFGTTQKCVVTKLVTTLFPCLPLFGVRAPAPALGIGVRSIETPGRGWPGVMRDVHCPGVPERWTGCAVPRREGVGRALPRSA